MFADEFGFATDSPYHCFRTDADILIIFDEKSKLRGQVDERFVVWRSGQQDALAIVGAYVVLDHLVTLTFAIAQVVALIDQDRSIASKIRQFAFDP